MAPSRAFYRTAPARTVRLRVPGARPVGSFGRSRAEEPSQDHLKWRTEILGHHRSGSSNGPPKRRTFSSRRCSALIMAFAVSRTTG